MNSQDQQYIIDLCQNFTLMQEDIYIKLLQQDPQTYYNISIDPQVASGMIVAFAENIKSINLNNPDIKNYIYIIQLLQKKPDNHTKQPHLGGKVLQQTRFDSQQSDMTIVDAAIQTNSRHHNNDTINPNQNADSHIQDSFETKTIDKYKEIPMIGIPNFLGYNCYITSVIQIIIRIPEYWFAVADTLRIMKENQSIQFNNSNSNIDVLRSIVDSRIYTKFSLYYNLLQSVFELGDIVINRHHVLNIEGKYPIANIANICQQYFNDGSGEVMNSADSLFLNILEAVEIFNPIACKYFISSQQKVISQVNKNHHFEETYFIPSQIPPQYLFTQHSLTKNIYHQYKFNDVIQVIYSGNYQKSQWSEVPLLIGQDSKYAQKHNQLYYLASILVYVNGNHYISYQYQHTNNNWYLLNDGVVIDINHIICTHKDGQKCFQFKSNLMYPTVIIYRKKEKLLETSQWICKYGISGTVKQDQQLTINNNIKDKPKYQYQQRVNPFQYELYNLYFVQFQKLKAVINTNEFNDQVNQLLIYIEQQTNKMKTQTVRQRNSYNKQTVKWVSHVFPAICPFDNQLYNDLYDLQTPINILLYISDTTCFNVMIRVVNKLFESYLSLTDIQLAQYLYNIFGQFYILIIVSISNIREHLKMYSIYKQDRDFKQIQIQAGCDSYMLINAQIVDRLNQIITQHQNFNIPI